MLDRNRPGSTFRGVPAVLDERRRRILFAVVTEYIASGRPVGSRRLAKRYRLRLSPATIRNVLSDLEDAGFVRQPHTSAGRVPTDRGFRCFVDAMATAGDILDSHRMTLMSRLERLGPGEDAVRETAQLLSSLTGTATIISRPPVSEAVLDQLRFIALSGGRTLAVLVMHSGTVENRILMAGGAIEPRALERVNNYLERVVAGRTLSGVRDTLAARIAHEEGHYAVLQAQAREMVEATVTKSDEAERVVIEGQGALFDRPEFGDSEKIRGYLSAFDEKRKLLELLEQTVAAQGVQVFIGSETALGDVQDISVISSSYRREGSNVGSLGIVGPTRIDYTSFVPLVGFAADMLSDLMDGRPPGSSDKS